MIKISVLFLLASYFQVTNAQGCSTGTLEQIAKSANNWQSTSGKHYEIKKKYQDAISDKKPASQVDDWQKKCEESAKAAEKAESEWFGQVREAQAQGCDAAAPGMKLPRTIRGQRFKCGDVIRPQF